jgi:hypothetical protein
MTAKVEQLVYSLLIENTGRALGDSGDAYGRNWQRNAKRSIDDFRADNECSLEISTWTSKENKVSYEFNVTISLFHWLNKSLDLDELCDEFNALECGNWNGEFYGTDQGQCDWLLDNGFTPEGDGFNSYNGDSCLSQIIQGQYLDRDGDRYVLLQVHGGCDARGGYTDDKLFKIDGYDGFYSESCGFGVGEHSIDFYGGSEFINADGQSFDNEELDAIAAEVGPGVYAGDLF